MKPLWAGPAALPQNQAAPAAHTLAVASEPGASQPWEGGTASGVNTGNGNKLTSVHLLDWKVRGGMSLDVTLYHNSQTNYDDELGWGWTWTYDVYVNNLSSGNPILHWGDGTSVPYTAPGGGSGGGGGFEPIGGEAQVEVGVTAQGTATTYTTPAGFHDALVRNADGTWTVTKKDGTKYLLNAAGFLTKVLDRNGNAITLTLNAGNYVTRITDPTGRYVNVSVVNGKFQSIADQTGRTWTFTRNASDDLTSVGWPSLGDGNAYADGFAYSSHRISTRTDRRGKAWTFGYNSDGSLASETDPLGHATTYGYGSSQTTITNALGHVSKDNYSLGTLASEVDAANFTVNYTARNANRDVTSLTDARGKAWNATYDAIGNPLTKTDPLGHTTAWTYNGFSQPLTVTDALGHATTNAYDGAGNLLTVKNALNKTVVTNAIGSYGLVTSSTDALGKTTTFAYSADGDVRAITDATSRATNTSYDALGRVVAATDSAGKTTTTVYDSWERPVQVTYPATSGTTGASVFLSYLPTDQNRTSTDELGRITASAYDDAGRLTSVTNPRGDVQVYGYDDGNRRTTITNGRGMVRTYSFTNRGDVASLTMPDGSFEQWSYDGGGNATSYTNPLGQTILYVFDDAGRKTKTDYPAGTDTTFAYDAADRRTSMVDATGTTSWAYDDADRPTTFTSPQGSQTSGYDDADRRTSLTGTGVSRTWTYDDAGRVASLLNESSETTTFQYDAAGRLSRQTEANQNTQYAYDARGRTTQVKSAGNGGTTQIQQDYVYDDAGNLLSKVQAQFQVSGTVTTTYGYDAADQLTSESSPGYAASYTYDANGNRTSKTVGGVTQTYTVDNGDKLTSVTQGASTVKSYTYDAAGRTKTVVSSAGTTTLNYDYESRLTSVVYPGGATNTFSYNGLDTRVGKVDSAGTAAFRRDGAGVTAPVLSDGSAVYTPGVGQRRGGNTLIDRPDRLGTSIMQTSGLAALQATRTYDAFGVLTASTGTPQGPFGFVGAQGYQEDKDTGLKLLGHRYYDPSTGRFLTRDPLRDGRNWYAYCDSNPGSRIDANGGTWKYVVQNGKHLVEYIIFLTNKQKKKAISELPKHIRDTVQIDAGHKGGPGHHNIRIPNPSPAEEKLNKLHLTTKAEAEKAKRDGSPGWEGYPENAEKLRKGPWDGLLMIAFAILLSDAEMAGEGLGLAIDEPVHDAQRGLNGFGRQRWLDAEDAAILG